MSISVSQGSVIGPLLFNLFINDIIDKLDISTTSKIFADDIKIPRHATSCHVMSRHVTSCHVIHVISRHVTSCHVMSRHVMSRRKSWDCHTTNASLSTTDFFHKQLIQIRHNRIRWLSRRVLIPYRISGI